ncbi:MAG TPA: IS607 family element RNA-guided endonuclease TnpB [Streptosporangiaceae bacterium]|nr:IS607 family element RNA-guided endonuclease TnpB [Streptosporangiaceae bacterium]
MFPFVRKYATAPGMVVRGWTVRLEPDPAQAARFQRDCGARRFAYNWAVTQMGEAFDHGNATGKWDGAVWSAYSLRKRWNQVKVDVAPWWAENSKEAYATGITDAVTALRNWHASKTGKRVGPPMQFPRRKKKSRDRLRCTYTTGALRVEGPRIVVLPRVGQVRTSENLRSLWRHVRRGSGRLLAATVAERAGHWFVSLRLEIAAPWQPPPRVSTVGVDVGIGNHLLVVMRPDGSVEGKVRNPRPLRGSLAELRKATRSLSRKSEGSRRWRQARRRLGRAHARVENIRNNALHQATTRLAKTHGQIVIEDLGVRQLARGLRSHRKGWADAAAGKMRRQLTYKADWYGCELWIADRYYPSSKTCSACGLVNATLTLSERSWTCQGCGVSHDRDENAGVNLACLPASWAEAASDGKTAPVRRVAVNRVNHPGRVAA